MKDENQLFEAIKRKATAALKEQLDDAERAFNKGMRISGGSDDIQIKSVDGVVVKVNSAEFMYAFKKARFEKIIDIVIRDEVNAFTKGFSDFQRQVGYLSKYEQE